MITRQVWLGLPVDGIRRSLPTLVAYLLLLTATLTGCATKTQSSQSPQTPKAEQLSDRVEQAVVRIGYQKGTAFLNILKGRGSLEKRFGSSGVTIKWSEFSQGPPMMEAMNAGSGEIFSLGLPSAFLY